MKSPWPSNQIHIKIDINEKDGSAFVDFEGTGPEIRGNLNAPISVVHAAVIYCIRSMLDVDIPLNAGCLVPIKSVFLHSSFLLLMCNKEANEI